MSTSDLSRPARRRFSLVQLVLVVPWIALVIDAWSPIRDNSFLWHVRAGTLQAESGEVLIADPFSFTRLGEPWLTQSWLAELFYGWAESMTGLDYVPWMLITVTTLTFVGIALIGYLKSRSVTATAFILILSTLLLISFLVPRPVVFSYLLFVLVILAWERPGARWAIPFLFWVWASVHGSFIIGLAYVGLMLIMRRDWKWLPAAFAAGLATLLTAHGTGVVEILLDFGEARETLALLSEWRRPTLTSVVFLSFLGGVAFIVIGAFRKRIGPHHLLLLVPFLFLGFSSLRAIPPAWIGIIPLVGVALSDLRLGTKTRLSTGPALVFVLVVLGLPVLLVDEAAIAEDRFPIEATQHLADLPTFHDDRVGGYLIWAEWPDRLVYLDDRAELYLDRMAEFVDVREGKIAWRPIFERDGVGQALLRRDERLIPSLNAAGWQTIYEDEEYVVLRP